MVNWILENGVFGCSMTPLAAEICKQEHHVKIIDYTRGITDYQNFFPKTECIIFYGSLHIAEQIIRQKKNAKGSWNPGILGTIENYDCTNYYPHLKPWLLNAEGYMLPLSELSSSIMKSSDRLFHLQKKQRFFVRPNSPLKPFAGGLYSPTEVADLDRFMKRHYLEDPEMLVVVAPEKNIEAEWRAIVSQGQILCASQYRRSGKPYYRSKMPDSVQKVAQEVAQQPWQPDPIWVVDFCYSGNSAYVLEINFLSCSALYRCELSSVVREASKIAWEKWMKVRNQFL